MKPMSRTAVRPGQFAQAALACGLLLIAFAVRPAIAAGCAFEPQGEGRVVSVVDARTFRLEDGREVRLAGVEAVASEKGQGTPPLSAVVAGGEGMFRGGDDTADRHGGQPPVA